MQVTFGNQAGTVRQQVNEDVARARQEVKTMSDWGGRQAIIKLADAVQKLNTLA